MCVRLIEVCCACWGSALLQVQCNLRFENVSIDAWCLVRVVCAEVRVNTGPLLTSTLFLSTWCQTRAASSARFTVNQRKGNNARIEGAVVDCSAAHLVCSINLISGVRAGGSHVLPGKTVVNTDHPL